MIKVAPLIKVTRVDGIGLLEKVCTALVGFMCILQLYPSISVLEPHPPPIYLGEAASKIFNII